VVCAAIPNARILEYDVDDVPWRDELVTALPEISAGELRIPSGPGWGVDLNEDGARRASRGRPLTCEAS
jgi:L-alanine-DL-glutamate epimerase-like enolase superfamily enzyme